MRTREQILRSQTKRFFINLNKEAELRRKEEAAKYPVLVLMRKKPIKGGK